jgi:hypothetical protein
MFFSEKQPEKRSPKKWLCLSLQSITIETDWLNFSKLSFSMNFVHSVQTLARKATVLTMQCTKAEGDQGGPTILGKGVARSSPSSPRS